MKLKRMCMNTCINSQRIQVNSWMKWVRDMQDMKGELNKDIEFFKKSNKILKMKTQ
jgi:hypothetical protein